MPIRAASDTTTSAESRLLQRVFAFDRALTLAFAVALIAGCTFISDALDWPVWVVAAIGGGLLPVIALLHIVSRSGNFTSGAAKLSVGVDAAWVIASVIVLLRWQGETSAVGGWGIATVALTVAAIGIAKLVGMSSA